MAIIAANKIAAYIEKHPEAKTDLLLWLKNQPYRNFKIAFDAESPYIKNSIANVDGSDYMVKLDINLAVDVQLITWVGTKAAHEELLEQQRRENYQEDIQRKIKVVSVKLSAKDGIFKRLTKADLIPPDDDKQLADAEPFDTLLAYKEALARAVTLIQSKHATEPYNELLQLLPRIKRHERFMLEFPKLTIPDIVKARLQLLNLPPDYLPSMARADFDPQAFLDGQIELPTQALARLYKSLALQFPVEDRRFM